MCKKVRHSMIFAFTVIGLWFQTSRRSTNELGAVAPDAVQRIAKRDFGRIASVPGILGEARLPRGGLGCKGRQRWAAHARHLSMSSGAAALKTAWHDWWARTIAVPFIWTWS